MSNNAERAKLAPELVDLAALVVSRATTMSLIEKGVIAAEDLHTAVDALLPERKLEGTRSVVEAAHVMIDSLT